jgi:hypothetical protein
MSDIVITMKDGTVREFKERGRPGGSYSQTVRYEGAFVIVMDEWRSETAIPAADVSEVKKSGERGGW